MYILHIEHVLSKHTFLVHLQFDYCAIRYSGFVTSDPVINLDSDVRYSVNQVPPAKVASLPAEPKGYVPLIGSEVDVREELSQQQV